MQVMLCGFIPEDEWLVLAELSYFFRSLCAKELSPGVLDEMEELAPELICKLEKIFPPGFFNPMQHLILHLQTFDIVDTSPNSRMERSSKRIPSKSKRFSQSMEATIPVSSLGSNKG